MYSIPEQFAAAAKAHFETQLGLINALTSKAFEGVERVVALNVDAAKASLEEVSDTVKQIDPSKGPQELFAVAAKTQPTAEKMLDYGRHLAEIATGVQAEFADAAEAQVNETKQKLVSLVDEATKNAPPGSENTIAVLKSVIDQANAGYEQLVKSAKQTVETLQGNMNTAASQFTQAAGQFTQTAEKAASAKTTKSK